MLQNSNNNGCQIVSEGCCVELGNEVVLDDVTFSIKEGTLVGVVGPNGGGKTTLFNTILGLVPITHGSMKIKGLNPNEATGMIGYVPQKEEFNWKFQVTAKQVVQMGITKNSSFLPTTSKKDQEIIEDSLAKVALLPRINDRVEEMSGGQRQRVLLARTLAQGAEILLLDEPTNHLDMVSRNVVEKALVQFTGSIVCISHDRHFLNKVTNLTCEIGGGGIQIFEGNYDYYMWKKSQIFGLLPPSKKETSSKDKSDYKKRKKIRNRLSWIEKRFKAIENKLDEQRSVTKNPNYVDDYEKLQTAMETMTELETEYLGLMEEKESLQ